MYLALAALNRVCDLRSKAGRQLVGRSTASHRGCVDRLQVRISPNVTTWAWFYTSLHIGERAPQGRRGRTVTRRQRDYRGMDLRCPRFSTNSMA